MMNKQHHNMQDQKSSSHPSKSFSSFKVLPRNEVFHFKFITTVGILFEWNVNADINHRCKWRQHTTLHRLQSSASYSYQFSSSLFFTVDARRLLKILLCACARAEVIFWYELTYIIIVINWRPELSHCTRLGNFSVFIVNQIKFIYHHTNTEIIEKVTYCIPP